MALCFFTKRDLLAKLADLPDDAEVFVFFGKKGGEYREFCGITDASVITADDAAPKVPYGALIVA